MQVVNKTCKWSRNLLVDFVVMLDLASKVNCVYCSFSQRKIKCLFGLFSNKRISFLAQYEGCFYEKNCPRSNNKKDDYGVKKKSSNVTLS